MNLLIDTSNNYLGLILFNNQNNHHDFYFANHYLHLTDDTISELKKILDKNNCQLTNIDSFYLVIGPGSYTGVRVGLTIIKTIYAINPSIKVYCLNSLLFQAGNSDNVISIIDAKGGQKYFAVYNKGEELVPPQILKKEILDDIIKSKFSNYQIVSDYQNIYFVKNFFSVKKNFKYCNDINNLEPLYIKKAV